MIFMDLFLIINVVYDFHRFVICFLQFLFIFLSCLFLLFLCLFTPLADDGFFLLAEDGFERYLFKYFFEIALLFVD